MVRQALPELELEQLGLAQLRRLGRGRLTELVWLADDVEFGRRSRVSDLPELDLERPEVDAGFLVEPVDDLAILVRDFLGDPDDGLALRPVR